MSKIIIFYLTKDVSSLIPLQTALEGKRGYFGHLESYFKKYGFFLCGAWEYDRGKFDSKLWTEGGETIYLRIPFHVLEGELDRRDAYIEFRTPYVIKHVVNVGLDWNEDSLLSVVGLSQFQTPIDKDGHIHHKNYWKEQGEQIVSQIIRDLT